MQVGGNLNFYAYFQTADKISNEQSADIKVLTVDNENNALTCLINNLFSTSSFNNSFIYKTCSSVKMVLMFSFSKRLYNLKA